MGSLLAGYRPERKAWSTIGGGIIADTSRPMANEIHQGGCQCGAVRVEVAGTPNFVANCHCGECRKATGAAFSTWVGFANDKVRWLSGKPAQFSSSPGVRRYYCPDCGTPLAYQGSKWPGETHLLIGVFDEPKAFTPRGDAFVDEALPWVLDRDR